MFSCFGKPKTKTPPTPIPNLDANVLRKIALMADPKTARTLSRATSVYTRKTMPIGLAVTKVGPRTVPMRRPAVVNRSAPKSIALAARTPSLRRTWEGRKKLNHLDSVNPIAYRNRNWKYYFFWRLTHVLFFNSPTGQPFLINKKTGERIPLNVPVYPTRYIHNRNTRERAAQGSQEDQAYWTLLQQGRNSNNEARRLASRLQLPPLELLRKSLRHRKKYHTWDEYLKRRSNAFRYASGKPQRNVKLATINNAVKKLITQNNSSNFDKISMRNLAWWTTQTNWMSGRNYKMRNGKLYYINSERPYSRNRLIDNIRLMSENMP